MINTSRRNQKLYVQFGSLEEAYNFAEVVLMAIKAEMLIPTTSKETSRHHHVLLYFFRALKMIRARTAKKA
jgi:hypothetical protein